MAGDRTLEGKNSLIADKMLKKVTGHLEKLGIPYILKAGTLLGIIRENRFLPWDNDIDITITLDYKDKLMKKLWRFWLSGYFVKVKRYHRDMKHFKKGEVRIVQIWYNMVF